MPSNPRRPHFIAVSACALACWCGLASSARAQTPLTLVALTGVPQGQAGGPTGAFPNAAFASTDQSQFAVIGHDGQIYFWSALQGTVSGIWRWTPADGLRLVAITGQEAPAMPSGYSLSGFDGLSLVAGNNVIAFSASVDLVGGGSSTALFIGSPTNLRLGARTGDPLFGAGPNLGVSSIGNFAMNRSGAVAIAMRLSGAPANNRYVMTGVPPYGLSVWAKTSQSYPSFPGSWQLDDVQPFTNLRISQIGQVAMSASALETSTVTSRPIVVTTAIVAGAPVLQPVLYLYQGGVAPGSNGFIVSDLYADATTLQVGGSQASLRVRTPSANSPYNYVGPAGAPLLNTLRGADVPGVPGATFSSGPGSNVLLNAGGTIAFSAQLSATGSNQTNDQFIAFGVPGAPPVLELLVREGSQAPGLPAGVVVREPTPLFINAAGTIVWRARLEGPGITAPTNDDAIFARVGAPAGSASRLVVRTGQVISIAPTDNRAVTRILFDQIPGGTDQGVPCPLSDTDRLVIRVGFGNSTSFAVLSADLAAAPAACYANCDGSTVAPVLNAGDFTCFLTRFRAATLLPPAQQVVDYTNCDASTVAPVLNAGDFTCFLARFRTGCP